MFAIAGTASFLLFLLGDLNDAFWRRRFLKPAFLTGAALLVVSTAGSIWEHLPETLGPLQILSLAGALLFTALTVWALFFSFPPKEAYVEETRERKVYTGGMYALCRHPGILWFCFLYGCLIPGAGFPPILALTYCLLNILLGWVEDKWIFPRLFSDYDAYRRSTPFLIPTARSLRAWTRPPGHEN
jgi:protein-S-isoprenylcysteine O-methyltransferase Ste14